MSRHNATPPTITPGLLYHDASSAIEWLCRVFGFRKRLVIPGADGTVAHAHLTLGNGGIMLSSAEGYAHGNLCKAPTDVGGIGTVELIVHVDDPDTHYAHACAEGAEIITPSETKPYGGRSYVCKDTEGHVWAFSNYDAWAEPEPSAG
ncbi:MAG: VOC family protein [Dokdonella sp.]